MKKRKTELLNVTLSLQAELDEEISSEDNVSPEIFFNMLSNRVSLDFEYQREWVGDKKLFKWFEVKESFNNRRIGTIEFEYEDKWEDIND